MDERRLVMFAAGALTGSLVHNAVVLLASRRRALALTRLLEHDGLVGSGDAPLRLVMMGDSGIAGNGLTDPDAALPRRTARGLAEVLDRPVDLTVLARSGMRTRALLEEFMPAAIDARPDAIVVSVGVNDVLGRVTPARLYTDTVDLVAALREGAPQAALVFCVIPDMRHAPAVPPPINGLLSVLSAQAGNVQREALASVGGTLTLVSLPQPEPGHYGADGFHPGPRGVQLVADAMVDELAAALGAESRAA